ncbi:hypothetical protein LMG29542_01819 [Paraburkholderia humisilvae]|uniref:Uncharacterized protein n=1 Tax=Paraburkholderia humisilvae TaxID=627669 RepID=A0A6J5DEH7_9BURK|nr:hypothetical protein LMG29542_01819 [Paraburkholderia humisilvae]
MRSKLHFGWSELKTLVPWKDHPFSRTGVTRDHVGLIPTLLLRANRYRGFGLYVMTVSGPVPVLREGTAAWFKSIEECADVLLDLDVDLDFENVLLDLGMWDCHLMPPRTDEPRPARPQCSRFARSGRRPLRPLGAQ